MIKTYEPELHYIGTGEYVPDMVEDSNGDWVRLDDHKVVVNNMKATIVECWNNLPDKMRHNPQLINLFDKMLINHDN